jgi:hypothetical protein
MVTRIAQAFIREFASLNPGLEQDLKIRKKEVPLTTLNARTEVHSTHLHKEFSSSSLSPNVFRALSFLSPLPCGSVMKKQCQAVP